MAKEKSAVLPSKTTKKDIHYSDDAKENGRPRRERMDVSEIR